MQKPELRVPFGARTDFQSAAGFVKGTDCESGTRGSSDPRNLSKITRRRRGRIFGYRAYLEILSEGANSVPKLPH